MFDWIPFMDGAPLWQQSFLLSLIFGCVAYMCYLTADDLYWRAGSDKAGNVATISSQMSALVSFALFGLFLVSGFFSSTHALAEWADKPHGEIISPSRVEINQEWDRERISVYCPESENSGEIELLGNRTKTAFRVRAIRMKANGSHLSVGAGFTVYQQRMWRTSTPYVSFGPFRADGKWQSRYPNEPTTFARGQEFFINADLGSHFGGSGWTGKPRHEKQTCHRLFLSF